MRHDIDARRHEPPGYVCDFHDRSELRFVRERQVSRIVTDASSKELTLPLLYGRPAI